MVATRPSVLSGRVTQAAVFFRGAASVTAALLLASPNAAAQDLAPAEPATAPAPPPAEPASAAPAAAPQAEAAPSEPTLTTPVATEAEPVAAPGTELAPTPGPELLPDPPKKPPWYETLSIRGYLQVRYNRFPSFDYNDDLINKQGDRFIGAGSGFGIRRARVILSGDVHDHVYIYVQPDLASTAGEQTHVAILRDMYADIAFDPDKTLRLRVGQSKVPFGFENMQSSQNRLPLDRSDSLNSAVKDERDLGAFLYWAPAHIRARFKHLVQGGLKGSGDYGVAAFGVFNGQTANQFDNNDNLHVVARLTWPFQFGEQFVEIGGGAYTGKYRVTLEDEGTTVFTSTDPENDLLDRRAFGSLVVYPQPIGFVAEYNFGEGPQQGENNRTVVDSRPLHGGYVQAMVKIDDVLGSVALIPYVRGTLYEGGKKFVTNAPRYDVQELELGLEWQIWPALEVVAAYSFVDRTSDNFPNEQEQGQLTRVQVQANF